MDKEEKKTVEKKMSVGAKIGILLGVLLVLALTIFAVWKMQDKKQPDLVSSGEITDVKMLEIETAYGTLKYPSAFTDVLEYEEKTEGDATEIAFRTTVFGDKVDLFTVYFQKPEKGTLIGSFEKEDEKVTVTIEMFANEPSEGATDNQIEKYYQMIDGVNDIVSSITTFEGYTEA